MNVLQGVNSSWKKFHAHILAANMGMLANGCKKNLFAHAAVYSIYFAKMIILFVFFCFQPVFLTLAKVSVSSHKKCFM